VGLNKVFVVCPGNVTSGGPELLHQLVAELISLGRDAYITYFPFDKVFSTPNKYAMYNVRQGQILDDSDSLVILPESGTKISRTIKRASIAVWWLSVDNFYGVKGDSLVVDAFRFVLGRLFFRRGLRALRKYVHLAQSNYALQYLKSKGIAATYLGDYTAVKVATVTPKKNAVVFNPRKGMARTLKIIKAAPELVFVAIEGKDPAELAEVLSAAKVYIDFGNHPGKDRLPREAALAHCCLLTNWRGSADNAIDIPIPAEYKFNDKDPCFPFEVAQKIRWMFENYERCVDDFAPYRKKLAGERSEFFGQVKNIFTFSGSKLFVAETQSESKF
jgi:hypothetical protein